MNYLRAVADLIRGEVPPDRLPLGDVVSLFDLYAALALSRGVDTTRRDVHDAWVVWMLVQGKDHPAMIPFDDLPASTQAEDEPFAAAIRKVAAALEPPGAEPPAESVEQAIRARFRAKTPEELHTLGHGRPFVFERIDERGIVLLLGKQRNRTSLNWDCLEGIVPFLRRHPGWVPAGGTYVVRGEHGTLDEHLKGCISRQTSRWIAVVLKEAGIVRVDKGPPLRVQLAERFRR